MKNIPNEHARQERYRVFFEGMRDPVLAVSRKNKITEINEAALRLLCCSRKDIMGRGLGFLFHEKGEYRKLLLEVNEKGAITDYSFRLCTGRGDVFNCRMDLWGGHGEEDGGESFVVLRDSCMERRSGESALFEFLADDLRTGAYVLQEGKFLFVNPPLLEYSGFEHGEMIGREALEMVHPDDRENTRKNAISMLKGKRRAPYEYRFMAKSGEVKWVLESVSSIDYSGTRAVLGHSMEITELMQARERLGEIEAFESSILDAIPHAVIGLEDRHIIFANDSVEEVFGWKPEELLGKMTRELYRTDEEYEEIARDFYPALEKEKTHCGEFYCRRKDGRDMICIVSASRVGDSLRKRRIVVVYQDISERKLAEKALMESEEKYSAVVEQALYGVLIIQNERCIFANQSLARMTGYEVQDIMGVHYLDIFAPVSRPIVARRYKGRMSGKRVPPLYEVKLLCRDGILMDAEIAFGIIRIGGKLADMGYIRDITKRKRAQKDLEHSMKRLQRRLEETVEALASMTEKRDPYTAGHQERVRQLAEAIAKKIKLPKEQTKGLLVAATLHDIGKIYEPAEILSKPDLLTNIEYLMMKVHPGIGYDILKNIDFPWPVAEVVNQHHERLDGSGYPNGLKGTDILLEARILAVADVVEAMASHRPYRSSLGIKAALREISKNSGLLYDCEAVEACIALFRKEGFKFKPDKDSRDLRTKGI